MRIQTNRKSGFTLVEIMIVVAIIGLLAAIAIPNFVKARTTAQENACINNLRQIDGAKEQWALENRAAGTDTPTSANVQEYIKNGANIVCPAGGTAATFDTSYTVGNLETAPACQINATDHILPGGTAAATTTTTGGGL